MTRLWGQTHHPFIHPSIICHRSPSAGSPGAGSSPSCYCVKPPLHHIKHIWKCLNHRPPHESQRPGASLNTQPLLQCGATFGERSGRGWRNKRADWPHVWWERSHWRLLPEETKACEGTNCLWLVMATSHETWGKLVPTGCAVPRCEDRLGLFALLHGWAPPRWSRKKKKKKKTQGGAVIPSMASQCRDLHFAGD